MNHDRIATLLASGLTAAQVSTVVGCTPARISQLYKEESFALLLSSKRTEIDTKDVEETTLSNKYNAAEHLLLNQVMEMAPQAELKDAVAALRVIGERQERVRTRLMPVSSSQQQIQQISVSITLPSHAIPTREMRTTAQNEVISIGDQNLTPLSSQAVTDLFSSLSTLSSNRELDSIRKLEGDYNEPISSNTTTQIDVTETLPEEAISGRY